MAKNVRLPLVMKNGAKVTDMNSLLENFGVESVVEYYLDGKLEKWLKDRYYEEEASAVEGLSREDPRLVEKLCKIFGKEYKPDVTEIDVDEITHRKERIARLRQIVDDEDAVSNIDLVAFDQEELASLYDKGAAKIYLCEGSFRIPESKQELEYVLLGNATVDKIREKHEKNEPVLEDIVLSDYLRIPSSETKKFQNARITIEKRIISEGDLTFENCEIIWNLKAEYVIEVISAIFICNKSLKFINCTFRFESANNLLWLICAENATVSFERCQFFGCSNLLLCKGPRSEVNFESCEGDSLIAPFVDSELNNLPKISLNNCTFKRGSVPLLDGRRYSKFICRSNQLTISNSSFEGFISGIAWCNSGAKLVNSTFIECSAYYAGYNESCTAEGCNFVRCINPLGTDYYADIKLSKCYFDNCYGKININKFISCNECRWEKGLMYINRLQNSAYLSNFVKCQFKDIQYQDAYQRLTASDPYEFQYYTAENIKADKILTNLDGGRNLINMGWGGSLKECEFKNINANYYYIITCYFGMTLEDCSFENCKAEHGILDKAEYTISGGLFHKDRTHRAYYTITNCTGID